MEHRTQEAGCIRAGMSCWHSCTTTGSSNTQWRWQWRWRWQQQHPPQVVHKSKKGAARPGTHCNESETQRRCTVLGGGSCVVCVLRGNFNLEMELPLLLLRLLLLLLLLPECTFLHYSAKWKRGHSEWVEGRTRGDTSSAKYKKKINKKGWHWGCKRWRDASTIATATATATVIATANAAERWQQQPQDENSKGKAREKLKGKVKARRPQPAPDTHKKQWNFA